MFTQKGKLLGKLDEKREALMNAVNDWYQEACTKVEDHFNEEMNATKRSLQLHVDYNVALNGARLGLQYALDYARGHDLIHLLVYTNQRLNELCNGSAKLRTPSEQTKIDFCEPRENIQAVKMVFGKLIVETTDLEGNKINSALDDDGSCEINGKLNIFDHPEQFNLSRGISYDNIAKIKNSTDLQNEARCGNADLLSVQNITVADLLCRSLEPVANNRDYTELNIAKPLSSKEDRDSYQIGTNDESTNGANKQTNSLQMRLLPLGSFQAREDEERKRYPSAPGSIALDKSGEQVIVADRAFDRICIFDVNGVLQRVISNVTQMKQPHSAIMITSGDVVVACEGVDRLVVFNAGADTVKLALDCGSMLNPCSLATNHERNFIAYDWSGRILRVFDSSTYEVIMEKILLPVEIGTISGNIWDSLAVSGNGSIFLSSFLSHRIFTFSGGLLKLANFGCRGNKAAGEMQVKFLFNR